MLDTKDITSGKILFEALARGEKLENNALRKADLAIRHQFIDEFAIRYGRKAQFSERLQEVVNMRDCYWDEEVGDQYDLPLAKQAFEGNVEMMDGEDVYKVLRKYLRIVMRDDPTLTQHVEAAKLPAIIDEMGQALSEALWSLEDPFNVVTNRDAQSIRADDVARQTNQRAEVLARLFGSDAARDLGYNVDDDKGRGRG